MSYLSYSYKVFKAIFMKTAIAYSWLVSYIKFRLNSVNFNSDFIAKGIPIINVNLLGKFSIGNHFVMHSGKYYNMIGRQQQCFFIVSKHAELVIGNNVGISCTAIVCWSQIVIEDNVRIGGGVVIYDTDFHSLELQERIANPENTSNIKVAPVHIKNGAFIGAHSIILKGVTIGEHAVIGAGSVVGKSIPPNQIWAGNPAKFIREI